MKKKIEDNNSFNFPFSYSNLPPIQDFQIGKKMLKVNFR